MKKILTLLVLLLAVHFLAVLGGVGYLVGTGALNKDKATQISEVLFPPPASQPTSKPSTAPAVPLSPQLQLEELMSKRAGRPATEQIEFIRNTFDEEKANWERRMIELEALKSQVEAARSQLARDRAVLDAREKALNTRASEAARLEQDTGFQNELALYNSMPAAQVKKVFSGMDDDLVARYLQAMTPRTASKILREFKTPEEVSRVQAIMQKVRRAQENQDQATGPASSGAGGAPQPQTPTPNGQDSAAGQPR